VHAGVPPPAAAHLHRRLLDALPGIPQKEYRFRMASMDILWEALTELMHLISAKTAVRLLCQLANSMPMLLAFLKSLNG
jgi:hypothetical protein